MMQESKTLRLVTRNVRELAPRIRAYELGDASGNELPLITAGSHIELQLEDCLGKKQTAQYAISSNPAQRDFYEIAVALEDEGSASHFIFNHLHPGTRIECRLPTNNFHLHADSSPAVLIAEGMGIAPIKSIAYTLELRGRRFSLHYVGTSKADMPFLDELEHTFPRQLICYAANEEKNIDVMNILANSHSNTLIYASGSTALLNDIETSARLLGIQKDRIQLEYFYGVAEEKDKPVLLELAYTNKLIAVDANQSLLHALRSAGVDTRFDCCVGDCGTCAIKVLAGEAEHRDHVLSDAQKAQGLMCVCVSRAKGDKLVLAL